LPVGFADGYSRRLSNCGHVSIHGRAAPVTGKVCMDMFMADVTDIPDVRPGDRAELIGGAVSILSMADDIGANVDEIVCGISARVPRIYVTE
ncbi:MAG: alanine racemase, partial [Oscillospiraceae bacterium]|nr:alanine racemase [Oscillospiraceae bacterium]